MTFLTLISLITSPLSFDLQIAHQSSVIVPIVLSTPSKNLSISFHDGSLYADAVPVSPIKENETISFSLKCITHISLHFQSSHANSLVYSPSLCSAPNIGLTIDETKLIGCLFDLSQSGKILIRKVCGEKSQNTEKNPEKGPIYIGQPVEVNEGGSIPIQWKNVYYIPRVGEKNVSNNNIRFTIVETVKHGEIRLDDVVTSSFDYSQLLARRVFYKHDGSESSHDSFKFQVDFVETLENSDSLFINNQRKFVLTIKINNVNDAPKIMSTDSDMKILIASRGRRIVTDQMLIVTDDDDLPERVKIQVVEANGVHVEVNDQIVHEFTHRQLIDELVSLVDEGHVKNGKVRLIARDSNLRSSVLTLNTLSTEVDVILVHNTGIHLLHHSSAIIKPENLTFEASISDMIVSYRIVDLPDTGVIECQIDDIFEMCTSFSQEQINGNKVRFRHASTISVPTSDMFSFQVEAGEFASMVHIFRIEFIAMNIKVFKRLPFVLNATQSMNVDRRHLFAWTFPKSYSSKSLVYNIEEPPKFGILSKLVSEGRNRRNRRIGVGSNFTQMDIDENRMSYKLTFQQFTILNDFFTFRVISPSVLSTSLRFDIVYIPTFSSIRLVNRTIIVKEGAQAFVTKDFLSLTTPDDDKFVFKIQSTPLHGKLYRNDERMGPKKLKLNKFDNFTTIDILEKRIYYEHSNDESRNDECQLIAISMENDSKKNPRRLPLTLSFTIILLNDNKPRIVKNVTLYMVERGERVFNRQILPWTDDDIDASALIYEFKQNKDAAILSTVSPYLPLTSFSQHDVNDGKVMIRHLGHHSNFELFYTVTDGVHKVDGFIRIIASQPNVWLERSLIEAKCPSIFRVDSVNLNVLTNLDVMNSDIIYKTNSNKFRNSGGDIIKRFTQHDVDSGEIWINLEYKNEDQMIKAFVADRVVDVDLKIKCVEDVSSLMWNENSQINNRHELKVARGGAVAIDVSSLLTIPNATYEIIKHPQFGYFSLENSQSLTTKVTRFDGHEAIAGNVHYVHTGSNETLDSVVLDVLSDIDGFLRQKIFINFEIFDRNVSIKTKPMLVPSGGNSPLTQNLLEVTTADKDEEYIIDIISPPTLGWITSRINSNGNSSKNSIIDDSISTFSGKMLLTGNVWFVSDGSEGNDSVAVRACVQDQCSPVVLLPVIITRINVKPPILTRNEVLRVTGDTAIITNMHLNADDEDTPTNSIEYLISQPSNGYIALVSDIKKQSLMKFTQFDIDQSNVIFHATNRDNPFGGFSFHVRDGKQKIGPEWFTIELSSSVNVLEANGRLVAIPGLENVIGAELLRANMPFTKPDDIIYTIIKKPKHGKLLIGGEDQLEFTQAQINRRQVVYASSGDQAEWSRRDAFIFRLSKKDSHEHSSRNEKFRITTTYASMNDKNEFIKTKSLFVSRGGSVCLNQSHFDISPLADKVEKEVIMFEVSSQPRAGRVEWVDNELGRASWTEIRAGAFMIIYHHDASSAYSVDTIVLHVYAASESTRRASRIRVAIDVQIRAPPDPLLQIIAFPKKVVVMNSGSSQLLADSLMARHPSVPPQSIVYRVIQTGTNGCSLRRSQTMVDSFTQNELIEGRISVWHIPNRVFDASWHDLIVLDIAGNIKVLRIEIRPLDLTLKNHTIISYPQGKTYVVLDRRHLGALTNSNRSAIRYKITNGPTNGTFYWVAGEKEAKQFTQSDIDNGRILYAQLNMHSYQDKFEFVIENDSHDVVKNSSRLEVTALVSVQPVIIEAGTATPLTTSQINATALLAASPRFFLVNRLSYGRLTFDPSTNYSTSYFTYSDIQKGIIYYEAFYTDYEMREIIEFEVRADSVQPARFILPITILRADDANEAEVKESVEEIERKFPLSPKSLIGDNGLPVVILCAILIATVVILMCLKCGKAEEKRNYNNRKMLSIQLDNESTRLPPSPTGSICGKPADLLDTTVFASVRQSENSSRENEQQSSCLKTFVVKPPKRPVLEGGRKTGSGVPSTPRRYNVSSLDYSGVVSQTTASVTNLSLNASPSTPPKMRLFDQVNDSNHSKNHYWV